MVLCVSLFSHICLCLKFVIKVVIFLFLVNHNVVVVVLVIRVMVIILEKSDVSMPPPDVGGCGGDSGCVGFGSIGGVCDGSAVGDFSEILRSKKH